MSQLLAAAAPIPSTERTTRRSGPILVAVGPSDAETVLRAAHSLAADHGGGVLAVTVLETLPVYAFGLEPMIVPPEVDIERRSGASRRLHEGVQSVAGE